MAQQVQFRRGTTTDISTFVGVEGEVVVDTTKDVLVVMDGSTSGGFPVAARANADGTIGLIKKDGTSAGSINSSGLFNNTLTSTNTDQALTAAQGKVLQDNKLDKTAITAIGSAPMYACRAWVNFNGTGTVAIRGSGNVSSITDNGVGDYTINFTTALQDINYNLNVTGNSVANGTNFTYLAEYISGGVLSRTTNSVRVLSVVSGGGAGGATDHLTVNVAVFR